MNYYNISVIIPVYNCMNFLERCIESLLSQTFNKFEIILVDDGSTDGSEIICDRYANKNSNIRVLHQENQGVSRARENGLKLSNSEYIAFIDSDDYVKEDYLENLYFNIIESKADFVCCNSIDIGNNLPKNKEILDNEIINSKEKIIEDYFLGKRYAFCIWGKLYRKSLLTQIEFPKMKYAEDTYMILNLIQISNRVYLITYRGYYYVEREKSATFSLASVNRANDSLKRSKFLNEICFDINNKSLIELANYDMGRNLYWAIITNSMEATQKEFEKFIIEFDDYYKYCKCTNVLKSLIIKLFKLNYKFTKFIIKKINSCKRKE